MFNKLKNLFKSPAIENQFKEDDFQTDGVKTEQCDDPIIPKEEPKKLIKKRLDKIEIFFNNDSSICFDTVSDLNDIRHPYREFYTWFFSRTTEWYTFKHRKGETIFKRSDICKIERLKTTFVDK